MANCNGTVKFGARLIESIQTVVPTNPTEPRRTRPLSVPEALRPAFFRAWFHVVLYFKKAREDDSGWVVAGWIKESLGKALMEEEPLLAGRLRRADGGDRGLEIVSNDSGVRLYEARVDATVEEFLGLDEEEGGEGQLVVWEDIDELNPQFSPLAFVQVTNFKCGGHSIGFSCSILVSDPITITSFIKRWAIIHRSLAVNAEITKLPIFYLPHLRKTGCVPDSRNGSIPRAKCSRSLIFKLNPSRDNDAQDEIAARCVAESERKLGSKAPMKYHLYVKNLSGEIKVENVTKDRGNVTMPPSDQPACETWKNFGADEIILEEGRRPVRASHWISIAGDEGLVMVILSPDKGISGTDVIVTVPSTR